MLNMSKQGWEVQESEECSGVKSIHIDPRAKKIHVGSFFLVLAGAGNEMFIITKKYYMNMCTLESCADQ